ncbi:MAG: hypothetical protein ACREFP_05570 [Acetobacteraceae bacterium]
MFDNAVVFFAAVVATAMCWWAWPQLPRCRLPLWGRPVTAVVVLVVAVVALLALAFGSALVREEWVLTVWGNWSLRWIFDGTGQRLLAGIIAGGVLMVALRNVWNARNDAPDRRRAKVLAVAAGPALLVAALFLVGTPGLLGNVGLTNVSVEGVTLNFASVPALPSTVENEITSPASPSGPSASSPSASIAALEDYAELEDNDLGADKPFLIDRDDANLRGVAGQDWRTNAPEIRAAIDHQKGFLKALRPFVACVRNYVRQYRISESGNSGLDGILWPAVDRLARLERAWRTDPTHRTDPTDLQKLQGAAQSALQNADVVLRRQMGSPAILGASPADTKQVADQASGGAWKECSKPICLPRIGTPGVNVPYLAIFVAYSYTMIGNAQAGLRVLNDWLAAKKDGLKHGAYRAAQVLWARVATEWGAIQVGRASFPFSETYRSNLGWELRMLQQVLPKRPDRWMAKHRDCARPTNPAERNLLGAYLNAAQNYLQAAVDTDAIEPIGPKDYELAKSLIKFHPRTLCASSPGEESALGALLQLEGGRTLVLWAAKGQRDGVLSARQSENMRYTGSVALVKALTAFKKMAAASAARAAAADPAVAPSQWEAYEVEAERQLLDLGALP